jgi:hypothetical protein
MNRDNAQIIAGVVERITKLENTIFDLQNLSSKDRFQIIGSNGSGFKHVVDLDVNEIATVVFSQDILEQYINTLNLELDELIKKLEEF